MINYQQIISPVSNRKIYVYGQAWNKLIDKHNYTLDELETLPKIYTNKIPKSPQIKKIPVRLTGIKDTDISILLHLDDETLKAICISDKYINVLCQDVWKLKLYKILPTFKLPDTFNNPNQIRDLYFRFYNFYNNFNVKPSIQIFDDFLLSYNKINLVKYIKKQYHILPNVIMQPDYRNLSRDDAVWLIKQGIIDDINLLQFNKYYEDILKYLNK